MGAAITGITGIISSVLPAVTGIANLFGSSEKKEEKHNTPNTPNSSGYSQNFSPVINITVPKRKLGNSTESRIKLKSEWESLKSMLSRKNKGGKDDIIFTNILKENNVKESDLYKYIDSLTDGIDPNTIFSEKQSKEILIVLNKLNDIFLLN